VSPCHHFRPFRCTSLLRFVVFSPHSSLLASAVTAVVLRVLLLFFLCLALFVLLSVLLAVICARRLPFFCCFLACCCCFFCVSPFLFCFPFFSLLFVRALCLFFYCFLLYCSTNTESLIYVQQLHERQGHNQDLYRQNQGRRSGGQGLGQPAIPPLLLQAAVTRHHRQHPRHKKKPKELGTTHEQESAKPSAIVPDTFKDF